MKTTLFAAAVALASFGAFAPVQAGNWEQTSVDVPYGDLNLSTPAGAQAMLNRIKKAASRACGGKPDMRDSFARRHYLQCVAVATAHAVAQLNAPLVTALHSGRPVTDTRVAQDKK